MRYAVFNRGLKRLSRLDALLGADVVYASFFIPKELNATLGWGRSRYSHKARKVAFTCNIPFICLEDGFLRSVGLGFQEQPFSIIVDDVGVYYDANRPSRLENLILTPLDPKQEERSRLLCAAWRLARVSKYNHLPKYSGPLPTRYVLVADQTFGDASIHFGLASANSFQQMLSAALSNHPDCTILLKIHPDVFSGEKRGHFDPAGLAIHPRVHVLAEDVHPVSLIEQAEALYVVTSQMGFEGLLWGKPVYTFGMPFYAGWGLTHDFLAAPVRRCSASLEQLVHAALIEYPRYLDPETSRRCEPERLIEWMGLQRRMRERFPRRVCALDFSRWKKPIVRSYFQGTDVVFKKRADTPCAEDTVTVWGLKPLADQLPQGGQVVRLEDGFLRSVGLGANLVSPVSWVMDKTGIYFDATRPSDLEQLLQSQFFSADLIGRAASLRERIVAGNLTKYNVGTNSWQRPADRSRVILVPGQVESDASLAYGAPGINTNIGLLQAVRTANPDAWVLYKPHPDVLAGLRARGQDENQALQWCDEQLADESMGDLLLQVDELHTLTSLAGFEALLRGKRVVCYGQPFYSGWGLTIDLLPIGRRTRKLSLDELVAGTLILYPTYVSRITGRFTTPERALEELLEWRNQSPGTETLWTRMKRIVLRHVVGVR